MIGWGAQTHASFTKASWLSFVPLFAKCSGARGYLHRSVPVGSLFGLGGGCESPAVSGSICDGTKCRRCGGAVLLRQSSHFAFLPLSRGTAGLRPAGMEHIDAGLPPVVRGFCASG